MLAPFFAPVRVGFHTQRGLLFIIVAVCATVRTGNGGITAGLAFAVMVFNHKAIRTRPIGGTPVETHAHPYPADDQVMRSRALAGITQLLAEMAQGADGVATIDDSNHGIRNGVEDFASPLVYQMRRRNDQYGFVRVTTLHQRGYADAHHRLAGAHLAVQKDGRQVVFDQPGIAGKDAMALRGKGLAFQAVENRVLPGSVCAVVEDRCLFADLLK